MAAGSVWSSLGCRQRGVNAAAGIDLRHCYRAPRDRKFATRPRRFGDPEGIWPYSDPGLASSIAQKGGPCLLMQRVVASIRYRSGLVAAAVLPEAVYSALIVMQRHRANIGVFPNIVRPKTYNEKVLHRMLFDRRPIRHNFRTSMRFAPTLKIDWARTPYRDCTGLGRIRSTCRSTIFPIGL